METITNLLAQYNGFYDGISDDFSVVVGVSSDNESLELQIESKKLAREINRENDLLVNGVRGKVLNLEKDEIRTKFSKKGCGTLLYLTDGDYVNLQKIIKPPHSIRAQLVTGYIDGIGKILTIDQDEKYIHIWIGYPVQIRPYLFKMGYICGDGICLTIQDFDEEKFKVSLFPKTRKKTSLGKKTQGDSVNIESSIIAKILEEAVNEIGCVGHEKSILHWLISPY